MKLKILVIVIMLMVFSVCYSKGNKNEIKKNYKIENSEKTVFIPIRKDGLYGFADISGEIKIKPSYYEVKNFNEGLSVVKGFNSVEYKYKYGAISQNGKEAVNLKYDKLRDYSEGRAIFYLGDKCGIVDKNGKEIVKAVFDDIGDYSEEAAWIKMDNKYGYVGINGNILIKPQFDNAYDFRDGAARVIIDGSTFYINKNGEKITPGYLNGRDFSEGSTSVLTNEGIKYIDKTGNYIFNNSFEVGKDFKEGMAIIRKKEMYGFINKKGEEIVEAKYNFVLPFSEGVAVIEKDGKCGYIDKTGKIIINNNYDEAFSFYDGLARVRQNGKYGFVNKAGENIIETKYSAAENFKNGAAKVERDGKIFFINKQGKEYDFTGRIAESNSDKPIEDILKLKQDGTAYVNSDMADKLLVEKKYQDIMIKNYEKNFFRPWKKEMAAFEKKDIMDVINGYKENPGYGQNKLKNSMDWLKKIADNCDTESFPSLKIKAITIRASDLRVLPTIKPIFSEFKNSIGGYPFDDLQNSALDVNSPVLLTHKSKDGEWYFAESAHTFGWIKSEDVAFVNDDFIKSWQTGNYISIIEDGTSILDENGLFRFKAFVGCVFPIVSESDRNFNIRIAISDENKNAVIKTAVITKDVSVKMPIDLTEKNIGKMINAVIGKPYGWGGMYQERDCSSTLRDLFTPFGLWLPRNSGQQAGEGIYISLKDLKSEDKEKMIIENGVPYLSLIWMKGHIILYIGKQNGKAIVFQNIWGVRTKENNGETGRKIIGGSVITTLRPGIEAENSYGALLDRVNGITILIPPKKVRDIIE